MNQLKNIGVSLAIDDFGTGYSSLSQLKDFPVDVLKIDQSFVKGIEGASKNRSIVKLILGLTSEFNYNVIVEGVETEKQYDQLKKWGCNLMQGFLFSKPVPADEFARYCSEKYTLSRSGT